MPLETNGPNVPPRSAKMISSGEKVNRTNRAAAAIGSEW